MPQDEGSLTPRHAPPSSKSLAWTIPLAVVVTHFVLTTLCALAYIRVSVRTPSGIILGEAFRIFSYPFGFAYRLVPDDKAWLIAYANSLSWGILSWAGIWFFRRRRLAA
ncbi:MAG: hypothetical protein QM754_06160 [Tepidisphaeraceae bacterium]